MSDFARVITAEMLQKAGSGSPKLMFSPDIDLEGVKVLIVDDEADSRLLTRRLLERANACVLCAESAAQALVLIRQHQPDVLLSDITMPLEDGYELIRKVRGLDPSQGGSVPAAAVTALVRPEDRNHALRIGFQLHIPKPIDPLDFLAAVKTLSIGSGQQKKSPSPPAKGNR